MYFFDVNKNIAEWFLTPSSSHICIYRETVVVEVFDDTRVDTIEGDSFEKSSFFFDVSKKPCGIPDVVL